MRGILTVAEEQRCRPTTDKRREYGRASACTWCSHIRVSSHELKRDTKWRPLTYFAKLYALSYQRPRSLLGWAEFCYSKTSACRQMCGYRLRFSFRVSQCSPAVKLPIDPMHQKMVCAGADSGIFWQKVEVTFKRLQLPPYVIKKIPWKRHKWTLRNLVLPHLKCTLYFINSRY